MFKRQIKDLFLTNAKLNKYFEYYYIIEYFLSQEKIEKIIKDLNWENKKLKLVLMNVSVSFYDNFFEDEKEKYQMVSFYFSDAYEFGFFKLTLFEPDDEIDYFVCAHPRLLIDVYGEEELKNLDDKKDYSTLEKLKYNYLSDSQLLKHYDKTKEMKIKIKNLKRNLNYLEENLKRL